MGTDYLVACGGVALSNVGGTAKRVELNVWPGHRDCNIKLRIEDLHQTLWRDIPDPFQDLLEIAAYVYSCDQLAKRGGAAELDTFGEGWRRHFHFHIPVRVPDLWNSEPVMRVLRETLEFLSDDLYDFTFHPAVGAPAVQSLFDFGTGDAPRGIPEAVMMFSGGLDSLAGAIEEVCRAKRNVVMVNHRSTPKFSGKHRELQNLLVGKASPLKPMHLHVRINKNSELGCEYTQRSRSFLYAALGATAATVLRLKTLRFYENGVVSLNLPVCAQVIGGRATRTTHPKVLDGFQRLFTLLADEPFLVENPFLWDTKADVIRRILREGCGELIAPSRSCAETRQRTNTETHCGTCSQCIDRRFGIIAAGAEAFDPVSQYELDLFTKSLTKPEEKILAAAFLERANQVSRIVSGSQFIRRYPEVLRAARFVGGTPASSVSRMLDLYKRHATEVNGGVEQMITRYRKEIRERTLPADCLVRIVVDPGAVTVLPAVTLHHGNAAAGGNGSASRYVFRKAGSHWDVVFDGGEEFHLEDTLGARYIGHLFEHPNQAIHALDLELAVNPDKKLRGKVAVEKGYDPETEARYRTRLQEIRDERRDAQTNEDWGRLQALDEEAGLLEKNLVQNSGTTDAGEQARNNVRKAIGAVKQKLLAGSSWEKAFGQHIEQCVSTGFEVMYIQPEGQIWQ